MNIRASLAALFVVASSSSVALAQGQPWIRDRAYGEGIGIRVGDLELHPGIAGEFGYDSNYFQRADDEDPIDTFRFRETLSLSLSTLGERRRDALGPATPAALQFRANTFAAFSQFLAADSDDQDLMSDQNHIDAGINFLLNILPTRPIGADLYGDFVRAAEPSNDPATEAAWDRDSLRLGAGVTWRPGGGLFDWRFGYEFRFNYFEQDAFQGLNNTHHYVNTRGRFRFLPRTALLYDAEYGWIRYSNEDTDRNDAETVRSRIGINGLVTTRFSLLALAGWSASFYEPTARVARNYDSFTGQVEARYFILPQPRLQPGDATVGLSSIAAGYTRDFTNSYLGDFYSRDRVYLGFSYFIGGRFVVDLQGGYSRIGHPDLFWNDDGSLRKAAFSENRIDAQLFAEYRVSDIVGINTTVRYDASLEDNRIQVSRAVADDPGTAEDEGAPAGFDNLQFQRWQAFIGARVFW